MRYQYWLRFLLLFFFVLLMFWRKQNVVIYFTGKLLNRTQKIAYNLLHKTGQKGGDRAIKPGDRVKIHVY